MTHVLSCLSRTKQRESQTLAYSAGDGALGPKQLWDENCPDSYTRRFSVMKTELNTCEALKLVEKIAGWGVFQLAMDRGEPFARQDLSQLVHHTAALGLLVLMSKIIHQSLKLYCRITY